MAKNFCNGYDKLFLFFRLSCNRRSCGLLRWLPFIKETLGAVVIVYTLAELRHVTGRYTAISILYVFSRRLVVIVFVEVHYEWHIGI